jgi:predicted TIM-barrel fold metal-dependent hydrolase
MQMNDMIIISVDDHIVEPADTFKYVPRKYQDFAPKMITLKDGTERWTFGGKIMATIGSSAVVGRSREERHLEPSNLDQLRKGCWDVNARVDDMSANGVLAGVNFGTLTGFAGELFVGGAKADPAAALALVQAYNDWHMDDWVGPHPARAIPLALIPLWDVNAAVAEVNRAAARGFKAISFCENSTALGLPSIHGDYWNPLWETICKHDLAVCIHIGTGGGWRFPSLDSPCDVPMTTMNITLADCMADFLFSPVLRNFPTLRIAMSEGYIGWVPFFKERVDYVYEYHRFWTGQDFGNKKPSDLVREHFLFCFTEDAVGVKNRHEIGIETLTWEGDYPHADSTWPESPERLWRSMKDLPDNEINMITHENAMRFFKFDPFQYMDRKDCTVGALRKAAAHVDTKPVKGAGGFAMVPKGKVLSGWDMKALTDKIGSSLGGASEATVEEAV